MLWFPLRLQKFLAMTKAFLAVQGGTSAASAKVRQMTEEFTARVEKLY